jgi:hypothetical protein
MSISTQNGRQHTADYDLGFNAGAKAAPLVMSRQMTSAEVAFVAHGHYLYFIQDKRTAVIVMEDFVDGWQAGYRAYWNGLI